MFLLIPLVISEFSPEKYISLVDRKPNSSSEDERKASHITDAANQKINQCFEDLSKQLKTLCINLDETKRKRLAVAIMICEQNQDGRGDKIPQYINDDQFIRELDLESFGVFTTIFTSLDTICFHAAHEQLSTDNLQKVLNVYKAVSISTEFLIKARESMNLATLSMRDRLNEVQETLDEEAKAIGSMQTSIVTLFEEVNNITAKASFYKNSITNAKFYIIGIGIGFATGIILPNVFLPILFVTGVYLFIEINVKKESWILSNGTLFKWSYALFCAIIIILSLWNQFDFFRVKVFGNKKEKKVMKIPILYAQQ
ncbi:hypothetical protein GPJ56_006778 [Histomonas meleagridis]|uniref:uncharacterized protein n=1 Tax=Histomonas meleagridis TaxID=135588 RepID=UPI003559AD8E|nr:hypothetical protein GPJ56_006778 [Histomonas meleagridis]KAH0802173.1 hypothetical protein GO595_005032 [Histomonas meleagridis]